MTDSPTTFPTPTRADRRKQDSRRRALKVTLTAIAAVIGIIVAGLVITDTLRLPGGPGPVLAGSGDEAETLTSSERAEAAAGAPVDTTRALTPDDPLRLWIAGDSLAGSIGPSLGEMTAKTGVVQPVFDSRVSSGLENSSFFDWPDHATDELVDLDPEAIMFIIGTNDATFFGSGGGWQRQYRAHVSEMMDLLVGNGRDVYWMTVPPVSTYDDNERGQEINEIFVEEAAERPDVTIIDAYALLSDSNGDYSQSLPDGDGGWVTLRAGDGVHLTADGGDRIADATFAELDANWSIEDQAVPDRPKQVIQTPGSSQIPGTYRPPSATSSGTPSTTPPSTTAPTPQDTQPPVEEETPDPTVPEPPPDPPPDPSPEGAATGP